MISIDANAIPEYHFYKGILHPLYSDIANNLHITVAILMLEVKQFFITTCI